MIFVSRFTSFSIQTIISLFREILEAHGYLKLDSKVSSDISTRTLCINVVINKLAAVSRICEKLNEAYKY